jgi:hypothetical protein
MSEIAARKTLTERGGPRLQQLSVNGVVEELVKPHEGVEQNDGNGV